MERGSVSKTSFRILKTLDANGKSSLTSVAENLDLSYPAVSRHLRGSHKYGFLDELIEAKGNEDDKRYNDLFIDEAKREEVDTLLEAYNIIQKYEDSED